MTNSRVELTIPDELAKQISHEIEKGVKKFLEELPQTIRHNLTQNAAHILGFRTWGNRWEIDTSSNNGRGPLQMAAYLDQKVLEEAEKLLGTIKMDFVENIKKGLQEQFERALQEKLLWKVSEKAEEVAKEILGQIQFPTTVKVALANPTLEQLSNPTYGQSPMEKHFMEEALREDAEANGDPVDG